MASRIAGVEILEVDRGYRIGVAAKAKQGGLPERQDAAEAPDEGKAERQHCHRSEKRQLHQREQLDYPGDQRDRNDGDEDRNRLGRETNADGHYRFPLKKRPEMPCGSNRIRTIAAVNTRTSP